MDVLDAVSMVDAVLLSGSCPIARPKLDEHPREVHIWPTKDGRKRRERTRYDYL